MDIAYIKDIIKKKGYKLTEQRKAILKVLMNNKDKFLTADEIHSLTKLENPSTNFSTVYRNLQLLEKNNIIHKTTKKDGSYIYELVCFQEHHHHIICKGCGKTEPIDYCPLKEINEESLNRDISVTDHKFELYGYCQKCN